MRRKIVIILVFLFVLYSSGSPAVYAQQPTFGPSCSPSPTIIYNTPIPPTARPTLLRTGSAGTTFTLLGLGGFIIFFGIAALSSNIFLGTEKE